MKQSFLPLGAVLGDPAIDTAHDLVFEVLQKTLQLPVEQFRASYGEVVKGMLTIWPTALVGWSGLKCR